MVMSALACVVLTLQDLDFRVGEAPRVKLGMVLRLAVRSNACNEDDGRLALG